MQSFFAVTSSVVRVLVPGGRSVGVKGVGTGISKKREIFAANAS